MNSTLSLPRRSRLLVCCCLPLAGLASAQDFAASLPMAPTGFGSGFGGGFGSGLGGGFGGPLDTFLDGFGGGVSLSGTYDSNVTQGGSNTPKEDDFILSLGGNVAYRTQGSEWVVGGNYRAGYDQYFDRSSLSGFNQGAGFIAGFQGAKLNAMYSAGFSFDRGANRYYSSFVERTSITQGLTASYRISPKTSIAGNMGYSFSKVSGSSFGDTQSFNAGISAMWRATPLIQVGPGIRYSLATGDRQPDRHLFGPTVSLNYTLSAKVSLVSTAGLGFVSYSGGGSGDASVFTSVGVNWAATEVWGMNLSLHRDVQADLSVAGAFNEITAIQIGYNRRVRRASFAVGLGYEHNSFENPGGAASTRGGRDYWSLNSSVSMPIFGDSVNSSVFASYRDQTSSGDGNSFDSFQIGFSLSRGF